MMQQFKTTSSHSFGRVCIVNNMYGLLQYLLISSSQEIDDTFFFFAEDAPLRVVKNFSNSVQIVAPRGRVKKMLFLLKLRYITRRRYSFLNEADIYGQDNLLITPPLIANRTMNVIEDGMANYTMTPPKKKFRWIKTKLIGPLLAQQSLGYSDICKRIYLTGIAPVPFVLKEKVRIINLQSLWDRCSGAKKDLILSKFNLTEELVNEYKKISAVLLTQPLSEDNAITEKEKIALYKKIIGENTVAIKPHPRERTNYELFFPQVKVLQPAIPIELLSISGVKFSDIYTIFSTSALAFPGKPNIHFIGTEIHPNLVKKWGRINYAHGKIISNMTNISEKRKVVVIGGNHHNTLGVIRSLGEKGITSDLILVSESKNTFVDTSKYLRATKTVNNDEEVIRTLYAYKTEKLKPIVICCSDASSAAVDKCHGLLSEFLILPGSNKEGHISQIMSKREMARQAREVGILPPPTWYVSDVESEISKIALPCIIKPLVSFKGKKADITICQSREELIDFSLKHDIRDFQIQALIDKDKEYQLIGCATGDDIIIPGVSEILRPCKGSNTSFLHYTPLEDGFLCIEKVKNLIRQTTYKGLFSVEFIRDKDGKDFFLEINFRNDGNAICVTAAGVNLPYIWYLSCIGENYKVESQKRVKSIYVMPDLAELKLFLTGIITIGEYIGDLRKTNRFMEYDRRDPKPFWKMLRIKILRF